MGFGAVEVGELRHQGLPDLRGSRHRGLPHGERRESGEKRCNRAKGNRTPGEAGMRLVRSPYRPQWTPFVVDTYRQRRHADWLPFLTVAETPDSMGVANG